MLQSDRQGRAIQDDSAGPKLTPSPGPLGGRKADAGGLQGDAGYVAAGCMGLGFARLLRRPGRRC
jgi:hypothetical protein